MKVGAWIVSECSIPGIHAPHLLRVSEVFGAGDKPGDRLTARNSSFTLWQDGVWRTSNNWTFRMATEEEIAAGNTPETLIEAIERVMSGDMW